MEQRSIERRPAGRAADQNRPVSFEAGIQRHATGSVLISTGHTRVICAASISRGVPPWLVGRGKGWLTAEYAMLPGSSDSRISRKQGGRGKEIQRLIGRSLRAAVDLEALDGFTVTVDCDVLDADGGTRTASITGAWLALQLACNRLLVRGELERNPLTRQIAAVSVGIVEGQPVLDLDYPEDSTASVDMNVVGTADGELIEVQGTAEGAPFSRGELEAMLDLAQKGLADLIRAQRAALLT